MSKIYIAATCIRNPKNLIPGRIVFTIFDGNNTPVQVMVDWLDPSMSFGELLLMVTDLRTPEGANPALVCNTLFMAMSAIRDHVVKVIGAGLIPSNQIAWMFDNEVYDLVNTHLLVGRDDVAGHRLADTERRLRSDMVFGIYGFKPADFVVTEMSSIAKL